MGTSCSMNMDTSCSMGKCMGARMSNPDRPTTIWEAMETLRRPMGYMGNPASTCQTRRAIPASAMEVDS